MYKTKQVILSLLLSVLIVCVSYFSRFFSNINIEVTYYLLIFIITFFITYFAFKYLSELRIKQILKHSPRLKQKWEETKNTKKIVEEISILTQNKEKELDLFYEKEMYRREFVGNVAHELKTPLFSIQGYLLTLIEGGVNDKTIRDKYLNRINKSVERLNYIVKDLDLITELESGNLELDIYSFNIVALAQEVFELLEIKAENNHITLAFDKVYEEPINVKGDIEKIEQVLMNLVVNGINHSQRDCKVTLSFTTLKDEVKVKVSDTGMGIKTEDLSRVFERFYRVDKSRSRAQGGSGLGLAIVKHILEAHNQKINVESTYGEGASFYFFLEKA